MTTFKCVPWGIGGCLVILVTIAGCSGVHQSQVQTAAPATTTFPPVYQHQIYPFEVHDAEGALVDHPFLGGLNLPRPQLVDIDGDGDLDLFLQELTGQLMHFENIGSAKEPAFVWRTNRYSGLDVGEWYRFVDLDQDGDLDLLGELPYAYVRLFRNDGTPEVPDFGTVIDSLRDASGEPLFADRQNIPSLIDVDCDGLLDLFVGRLDGTVHHYESVGDDAQGIPRMQLITERFEDIEIVAQFGSLHGANALTFHDVDNDGDPDLFWGDFFEAGVLLIRNTGTCAAPNLRNEPEVFPEANPVLTSGYNATYFADVDADGDHDFFVGVLGGAFRPARTAVHNFYFLESADGGYELRTRQFVAQIDVGADSYPTFADLDGDGDQDLLLSNKIDQEDAGTGHIYHFENRSEAGQVALHLKGRLPLEGYHSFAPALQDLDGDGDLDMVAGTWNDGLRYFRNDGDRRTYRFTEVEAQSFKLTRGSYARPALVDIDADGDYDLFVGEASGELNFYRNDGTAIEPRFVLISDNFDDIDAGRMSAPSFTDLDGDQDWDLVIGCEAGEALVYLNRGDTTSFRFEAFGTLDVVLPFYSAPAFADLDQDGLADLFSGGMGGGLMYFQRMP